MRYLTIEDLVGSLGVHESAVRSASFIKPFASCLSMTLSCPSKHGPANLALGLPTKFSTVLPNQPFPDLLSTNPTKTIGDVHA